MSDNTPRPPAGDPVAGSGTLETAARRLRGAPPAEWQGGLHQRVVDAIYALPGLFKTSLNVSGVRATDLFTLNSALGASIEQSVVENLNALRKIWDTEDRFRLYSFVRQAQVFPDVRLQTDAPSAEPQVLMGVELKGWFALAKEGEPSFRYKVAPAVCAEADLLVVFPWVLDEVVSGAPRLLRPFVSGARNAAEHRNHYWSVLRGVAGPDAAITPAPHQAPYPRKGVKFNDEAARDSGGNFGRVARGGIMERFIDDLMLQPVAGIPLGAWQRFLKIFSEGVTEARLRSQLQQIQTTWAGTIDQSPEAKAAFETFLQGFERLVAALDRR